MTLWEAHSPVFWGEKIVFPILENTRSTYLNVLSFHVLKLLIPAL